METIEGYYNGHNYVALRDVAIKKNQRVQIVILDEFLERDEHTNNAELLAKYKGIGGRLWEEDPQQYISALRADERLE